MHDVPRMLDRNSPGSSRLYLLGSTSIQTEDSGKSTAYYAIFPSPVPLLVLRRDAHATPEGDRAPGAPGTFRT